MAYVAPPNTSSTYYGSGADTSDALIPEMVPIPDERDVVIDTDPSTPFIGKTTPVSDWLTTTGTEFGEVDNPDYPGNSKAPWDTTQWNKGAWGDDISGWHNQGVALPNAPRGTKVEVRNPTTGATSITKVKDKGPGESTGAGIDILPGTGAAIGLPTNYKGPLEYKILGGGAIDEPQETPTPDKTQVSTLPEHLDLSGWDKPHNEPPAAATTVEPPPIAKSLIQEFYDKNPNTTVSQQGILAQMHELYAPSMPEDQFKEAATTPGGIDIIKEWKERTKSPIEQIRDSHPEWAAYTDDKLLPILYSEWTKGGQIDAGKLSYDEFMWRMKPPTDKANQAARFIDETISEFLPKSQATALWAMSGTEQHAIDNAEPTIRGILAKAYSPDTDLDQLFKAYQGMNPQQRKQEFAKAWSTLKQSGDSARLLDQLNTTFETIDKAAQIQESIGWMKKTLGQLDQPGPNQLPANQEKWAQTIAQLPSQAVMAIAPGIRELGLFGSLYAENKAAIEQNNPGMGNAEVAQKAEAATWWSFPGNELLQLSFLRGGPAIQGTILNRIKGLGLELGKEAAGGAVVGGSNQVFTNIAAGRDPMSGVFESAGTMATLGLGGRALGLTVEGLARAMKHVPEIRQAVNISSDIVGASPEEANKIVRGDPTAEVNLKATRNSIDLILSAHAHREAEKGNVPAWQARREAEIAGKTPEIEPPEKTPSEEAFEKAENARNNGDLKATSKHINEGITLSEKREQIQKKTAEGLKGVTRNNTTAKADPVEEYLGLNDVPGKVKRGVRMPEKPTESEEEAEMFSGGNPLPYIRKAAQWFRSTEQFKHVFDSVSRSLAPERRGETAEATGAIVKDTSVKIEIQQGIKAIAEHLDINRLFHNADRSDRRDAKSRQYSDEQIAAMQTIKQQGGKLDDPIMDKLFDFWRACYDWLEEIGRDNGIEFGHLANYFHHAFKNSEGEVNDVLKDWEPKFGKQAFQKTRHYATLADALAAGLKPKTYSPERNLMAYTAAMTTAIRQVQTLKVMAEEGLALPVTDVKEQGLTKQKGYTLYTAPDGKSYYVNGQAAQVLANAFDLHSIYDTMGGPFVGFARAFKGATGIKLSWSVFHPVHVLGIMQAETMADVAQRGLQGTGTAKDFWDGFSAAVTYGVAPTVKAIRKYSDLVDVLTTGKGADRLTDAAKGDLTDIKEMGLNPYMSDERRVTFADMIFRGWQGASKTRDILELGYYWLRMEPVQEWVFGKMIPSLKVAAALARRDTLLQKHGEAFRSPENRMQRLLEYQKINRDVEGRFGEMFYDNLLWKRQAKQIGTAFPLSLGWNLGFWRVYGDGIVDLMDNVAHIDQITKYAVTGGKEGRAPNLSNRLIYMANYTVMSMLAAKMVSMILGGPASTAAQELQDWFFPRIGRKPNGDDERVRTPFWTGEWASLGEHFQENIYKNQPWEMAGINAFAQYFGNKANPGLAAIYHFLSNRDFMGRDIFDNRDPLGKQIMDRTSGVLKDLFEPISWQGGTDAQGIPNEPKQVIASFLGFTQAPGWTTRSALQNEIITMFHDQLGTHTTKRQNDIFDAKTRYQYAIQSGDQRMQAEQLAQLHQLGAGPKVIEDARKFAKIPPAHRAYQGLTEDRQLELLRQMSPAEHQEYWPLTKAQAKMEYVKSQ